MIVTIFALLTVGFIAFMIFIIEVIYRYVNDMAVNDNAIGRALIDINEYAHQEAVDIKNAIKKALENIKKEFDEL